VIWDWEELKEKTKWRDRKGKRPFLEYRSAAAKVWRIGCGGPPLNWKVGRITTKERREVQGGHGKIDLL